MRITSKAAVLAMIFVFCGATIAFCVGYERYDAGDMTKSKAGKGVTVIQEPAQTSFLNKCPALLDEVTSVIKDVLGQLGLIKR